jgi:hypothetical protein
MQENVLQTWVHSLLSDVYQATRTEIIEINSHDEDNPISNWI